MGLPRLWRATTEEMMLGGSTGSTIAGYPVVCPWRVYDAVLPSPVVSP